MLQPLPLRWNRLPEPDLLVTLDKLGDIVPNDVIVVGDTPMTQKLQARRTYVRLVYFLVVSQKKTYGQVALPSTKI